MQKMISMMSKICLYLIVLMLIFIIFISNINKPKEKFEMQYGLIYNKYCEKNIIIRYNQFNHKEKVIYKKYYIVVLSKGSLYKLEVTLDDYKSYQVGKISLFDKNLLKNLEVDL